MDISTEGFREHFELLSDQTLLGTKRDDLVGAAQAVFDEEVLKRGLQHGIAGEPVAAVEAVEAATHEDVEPATEPLVSVGSYTILDEARLAQGLLRGAEIPCGLVSEKSALGALHLMVPERHLEAALEVLGGEISEEDLAAQAEAAGFTDGEAKEDDEDD